MGINSLKSHMCCASHKAAATKQLDVHIRFWEDDRVQSRYLLLSTIYYIYSIYYIFIYFIFNRLCVCFEECHINKDLFWLGT